MKNRWVPRAVMGAAVAALLAAVFAAYLNPHTVMDLATRVWSCF